MQTQIFGADIVARRNKHWLEETLGTFVHNPVRGTAFTYITDHVVIKHIVNSNKMDGVIDSFSTRIIDFAGRNSYRREEYLQ